MTAYGNTDSALEGMKFGLDSDVVSRVAGNAAGFGKPAMIFSGDSDKAYAYTLNKSVMTYSADFVTSNVINVSVNGVAISPVTFATDHATTFAAVITAIDALAGVTATAGAGRAINITVDGTQGVAITVTTVVTLGASQATATQVLSCSGTLFGAFLRTQKYPGSYEIYDVANIMREGEMWVMTADAVVANSAAYLVAATGVWTDESSGNVSTNYVFRTSTSGAALARLELV